ncbi:hypothetical protein FRC04_009306 [Tulasnella sp. 424]|nr:hypothetical protein FRC04_009306 [Tulasnella sp. 424]
MASTLQQTPSLDFETALTKFVAHGPIKTQGALEDAVFDLLAAMQMAESDVSSILSAVSRKINGLLEAVMTSRCDSAFTFRGRVMKVVQKASHSHNPVFTACAERLGLFFFRLPRSIHLEHSVIAMHLAFSARVASQDTLESEYFVAKKEKPIVPVLPKLPNPSKPSKRKTRFVPLDLFKEDPPQTKNRRKSAARSLPQQPPPPTVITKLSAPAPSLSEQLRDCLEIIVPKTYFIACIEDGLQEIAIHDLFTILNPPIPIIPTPSVRQRKFTEPRPSARETTIIESPKSKLPENALAPHDIARYLGETTKQTLGDWPVVVSQRGIKHLRQYIIRDKSTFSRIEKMIRQLSVGCFTESNHTKLLDQDHGVPIYTADLGGNLRLIYNIDFGAPTGASFESQFIRIFGVYAALEVDVEFWRAVSAHLGGRGDEYIYRCTDRAENKARSKRTKTVSPLVFPPMDISHWNHQGADIEVDEAHRKTTCMVFRMIGLDVAAKKSGQTLRQVFVTQSRTLARKVRLYCAQLMQTETNTVVASAPKQPQGLSLLDMDENAEEEGVLPTKFSELDDCHFPLFVTYDQLCKLLEADFNLQFNPSPLPTAKTARAKNKKSSARQPLISFDYFDAKIWPHMDHRLKRGLHSALVYSEFMGIIKGSETSLSKPRHYLEQSEYENQSNRSLSGDSTERSRVYTLFEAYHRLRPSESYDIADRVHLLTKSLRDQGVPGNHIDFLYVDEAQDNLIIDAALLRTLCPNPHGLFFAGDTAQTISVGSAFRFSELKAFLYRLEREDAHVKRGGRPPIDPQFFQLSTNYRSHSGIVNAAAFIVSLLDSYFQHSIDSLAPEVAHVDVTTHKPLFFSGMRNQADFLRLISDSSSGRVELGAHQVIIVRNEKAAADLKAAIGRVGVVLTLYESKGMEFNDVLLYNFFTDSPAADTDWRAMLFAKQEDRHFNARRHSILQSELKSFYVGLTRARERVWIWEETYNGHAMETLLVTSDLATSHETGGMVPQLATTSVADEWAEQAKEYFAKSKYLEAEFCFRKAGMTWWANVAQAYDHRHEATQMPDKHADRLSTFSQVAETFHRLAQEAEPSEDPESIRLLFSNAAECYLVVPDHALAADAFLLAGKYTQAAYHYRIAGKFDEAVDVVKLHTVDSDLAESITYAAKFAFTSRATQEDIPSLHKAWKLCADKEEFLDFLQDNGFEDQRVVFLDSVAEHEEAAQVLWDAGDYVEAVGRFRQARTPSSRQKATQCLLGGMRANVPFGTSYRKQSGTLSDLFGLAKDCEMSSEDEAEVGLFHAVINLQTSDLDQYSNEYFDAYNLRCALLALDAWTQSGAPETIESTTADDVANVLVLCQKFGWIINFAVRDLEFIDQPDIQTLFGISSAEHGVEAQDISFLRVVRPQSFIFGRGQAFVDRDTQSGSQSDRLVLPKNTVDDLIRRTLLERLNALIEKVDTLSRKSRPFEICTRFLASKSCTGHDDGTCWRDHVPAEELNIEQFNSRFRLHVLSIGLVDYWTAIDGSVDEERNRATKQKLFRLCYPSNFKLGNLADVTPDLIPEYSSVMPIVKTWLQEVFRSLRPGEQPAYFLTNLLTTCLLATAFDYKDAVTYLWRGQWSMDQSEAQENGLIQEHDKRSVVGTAIHWFAQGTHTRTNLGVHTLNNLLTGRVSLEVGVAAAFAEEICGQLILTEYYHTLTVYDGLTLPRSWIILAVLAKFLNLLLLKTDGGKLQIQGKFLKDATPPVRGQAITRLCRCLALIGHNIVKMKERIMGIFKEIMVGAPDPQARTEYQGYATACNWNEVARALRTSSASCELDELIIIRQSQKVPGLVAGMKTIFCPDEKRLLKRIQLADYPPMIALQCETLLPSSKQDSSNPVPKAQPPQINAQNEQEEDLQLESEAYTEDDHNGARIIQAFFRQHRRRAGGPIAGAFEDLANRLVKENEEYPPSRDLLLCIRGPLPHVLAYLKVLHNTCQAEVKTLTKMMRDSDHGVLLDELREQKDDLRSIHREVKKLIKDLHPSSEFYCQGSLDAPVAVPDIISRVRQIPDLLTKIREFTDCPEDDDYELGVEPLLSERVPWAPQKGDDEDGASDLAE